MDDRNKSTPQNAVSAQNAWKTFARTGQVNDYLAYYATAHPADGQEGASNANQNPGADPKGTEYR